jgi:ABC-type methionine transport system ATPase subunit
MKSKIKVGITMVMVTHDMYLKNFANRIVWIRDGKLAKVEIVPAEVRRKAIIDLRNKLEQINPKAAVAHSSKPEDALNRVNDNNNGIPSDWRSTEIRQPSNYDPVKFSLHQKTIQQTNNNNYTHVVIQDKPSPLVSPTETGYQSMTSPPLSIDSSSSTNHFFIAKD